MYKYSFSRVDQIAYFIRSKFLLDFLRSKFFFDFSSVWLFIPIQLDVKKQFKVFAFDNRINENQNLRLKLGQLTIIKLVKGIISREC